MYRQIEPIYNEMLTVNRKCQINFMGNNLIVRSLILRVKRKNLAI
ncbi:hypothetical protein ACWATR_10450 [Nostoc sp. UIC 10890]